jgi:hypothetical protein
LALSLALALVSLLLCALSLAFALLLVLDWPELEALELLLVGLLPPCPLALPPSPSPPPMCCSLLVDGLSWRGATAEALV